MQKHLRKKDSAATMANYLRNAYSPITRMHLSPVHYSGNCFHPAPDVGDSAVDAFPFIKDSCQLRCVRRLPVPDLVSLRYGYVEEVLKCIHIGVAGREFGSVLEKPPPGGCAYVVFVRGCARAEKMILYLNTLRKYQNGEKKCPRGTHGKTNSIPL